MSLESKPISLEEVAMITGQVIDKITATNPQATVQDLQQELSSLRMTDAGRRALYQAALNESKKYSKNQSLAGLEME